VTFGDSVLLRREDYVNDIHVYHTLRLDIHVSLRCYQCFGDRPTHNSSSTFSHTRTYLPLALTGGVVMISRAEQR
jgi:hypothetical protein